MRDDHQDKEKAEILKPLADLLIPAYIEAIDDGDSETFECPEIIWMCKNYPTVQEQLTRLFRKDYGKAASWVADAYLCGFVRGMRDGMWGLIQATRSREPVSEGESVKP